MKISDFALASKSDLEELERLRAANAKLCEAVDKALFEYFSVGSIDSRVEYYMYELRAARRALTEKE